MAHLSNPLVTPDQIYKNVSNNALPIELQDSIRFYTARLTQAAGVLLRLPQSITAQANVLLFRYWLVDDILSHEFHVLSAATLYLTAKISASPRTLRSITNVYAYLTSTNSPLPHLPITDPDPEAYYLNEDLYRSRSNEILHLEGQVLNALGFNTHVALPHPLAITYLQTMDVFTTPKTGKAVAKRTIEYLNTALLSPQMLYLTHQPASLATAAIYLAARDMEYRLPECEWWEVFDCDREELGFLVVALGSLEGVVQREMGREWAKRGLVRLQDVEGEMRKLGIGRDGARVLSEEEEMARLMDEKIEARERALEEQEKTNAMEE